MTTPRYANMGCAAESQAQGLALPVAGEPSNAWNVNFNNGNSNWNNRNNNGFVRAVRSGECHDAAAQASLHSLHKAFKTARVGKKASRNQLDFDSRWLDRLLALESELLTGNWKPKPSTCFIARNPKAREIHAPDFADRVVHHWLVPKLERVFEPGFIHDSYSNRAGKGTHAAVDRLQDFIRQVHSGQGGGWYLQLDVRNFFNTINRPTLWQILKRKLQRANAAALVLATTHALLRHAPLSAGVAMRGSHAEHQSVPSHKRLANAAPGCGLPIGNLSSQFFANVYLNELDQFVKHQLKAQRYLRYVDDFVIVHHDRAQLEAWHAQICEFLQKRLRLELKPETKLKPITSGCDFLGYIVYPTHRTVRPRVVHHAMQKLRIRDAQRESRWQSYQGHFGHARSHRLVQRIRARIAWLSTIEGKRA